MSIIQDDVQPQVDDIFSYMCSLAVAKCAKKSEKKKASCGGAAMRKRLLIKNFVAFMLEQEKNMSEKYDDEVTRELRKQLKGKIPSTSAEKKALVEDVQDDDEEETEEVEDETYEEEEMREENEEETEEEEESEEEEEEEEEYEEVEDPLVQDLNVQSFDDSLPSDLNDSLDSSFLAPTNPMFMYSECEDLAPMPPSAELDDCLSDCSYDPLFNKPMPPTFTSNTPSSADMVSSPTSAPSWRESEPDLYMLEGSRRYYDDYHTVPARDYSL
uniref:BESS domain-containing protein n=2 Tax=Bursaphelenchus xylophilus TaxID=6326 RepID=A0A1I7SBX3_BURXY